jgi:hypothetical protein
MDNEKKFARVTFPELGFEWSPDESGPESWNSVRHLLSNKPLFRPGTRKANSSDNTSSDAAKPNAETDKEPK